MSANPFEKVIAKSGVNRKAAKEGSVNRRNTLQAELAAMRKAEQSGLLVIPKGYDKSNDKVAAFLKAAAEDKLKVRVFTADVLTVKDTVDAVLKADGKAQVFTKFTIGKNARAYLLG